MSSSMIDCGGVSHLNLHLADVAGLASRLAPRDPFLVSISISLRGRIWAFTPDWYLHRFGDLSCEVENMQTYFGMSDTKKKGSLQRIIVFSPERGYHFCIPKHSWLRCSSICHYHNPVWASVSPTRKANRLSELC